ncbi:hypothetical protein CB0940_03689 [Cercospora beticola]|uniref:Uncharacterized protein n=1 Tax=Cercospora beticola TaxID=122368 RepID=A0A2G5I6E7_CERBT|nr:hypothetical protein CB0940_03689 [Cercospora beticola]PIB00043.1 hypothetical protein CB0940_03689 [Cercospora beticola]WPB00868.1 hypothetical protein RHO25_005488 [Cercospora beticola]
MKHESGIEVYLIPADGDGDSLKYPELHHKQKLEWFKKMLGTKETEDEYHARHNCCFIRRHENQRFKIVVRFNEGFEMYSSSAILIGVGIGYEATYGPPGPIVRYCRKSVRRSARREREEQRERDFEFEYHTIQKSFAVGQQIVLEGPNGKGYEVPEYIESDESPYYRIEKRPYENYVNPGTLTVAVQRGGHDWLDEEGVSRREQSKIGPNGPLKERPRDEDSFLHVYGKNGRKVRWEFRVRSLERMLEIEKRNRVSAGQGPMSQEEGNDPLRYTLIRDEDFQLKGKQGEDYRLQLQEEYLRKGERDKQAAARPRRERKKPKVCNCPEEHGGETCKKRKLRDGATQDGSEEQSMPRAKKPKAPCASNRPAEQAAGSSIAPDESDMPAPGEKEALTAPRECKKCRKYKKAPKGKKWFFVQDTGRWMLAPIDARDSFQAWADGEEADDETVQRAAGAGPSQAPEVAAPQQPIIRPDKDDEEIVGIEAKPAESETPIDEADKETMQQVTGAEQHLEPTRPAAQQPLFQQYENGQEIANINETRETQGAPNTNAVELPGASPSNEPVHAALDKEHEVDQVDTGTMQDIVPTAEVPSTGIPPGAEPTSTEKNKADRIWTPLNFTLHLYDGNSAAKTNSQGNAKGSGRIGRSFSGFSATPVQRPPSAMQKFIERSIWDSPSPGFLDFSSPPFGKDMTPVRDDGAGNPQDDDSGFGTPFPDESGSSFKPRRRRSIPSRSRIFPNRSRPRDQSHTAIDLTVDTASEIRTFKKEHSEQVESKYQQTRFVQEDSEDEFEAELRDIELRREEIQLERRQAELKRKLKQKAAAKRQSKVKQEIIEID